MNRRFNFQHRPAAVLYFVHNGKSGGRGGYYTVSVCVRDSLLCTTTTECLYTHKQKNCAKYRRITEEVRFYPGIDRSKLLVQNERTVMRCVSMRVPDTQLYTATTRKTSFQMSVQAQKMHRLSTNKRHGSVSTPASFSFGFLFLFYLKLLV